MLELFGVH